MDDDGDDGANLGKVQDIGHFVEVTGGARGEDDRVAQRKPAHGNAQG